MKRNKDRSFTDISPVIFAFLAMAIVCSAFLALPVSAQDKKVNISVPYAGFRLGEKITYNVSFGKFTNAAYVETSVVSRGNLSGVDVIELRSRMKTLGVVSAAFFQFDESRAVFVLPDTGLPVYVSKKVNFGVDPKEVVENFLKAPASSFELLSLIYKARSANGVGSFPIVENGQHYTVTFQPTISEKVKTEAGEFATVVSLVQSDYLTANGIKELKINFTADENRIPALIRIKTLKGIFSASVAAIQIPTPITAPRPEESKTPPPDVAPPVKATPPPYVENQPLSPELGFALGEKLDYNITAKGIQIASISLSAKERKIFQNEDNLLLTAVVTGTEQGNSIFGLGDSIQVQVDPETLAPHWSDTKFTGELKWLNQTAMFRKSGNILLANKEKVDAPIGTQTIFSLIYAMRSFNLKQSKDSTSPVNDTRVAVLWDSQPYVFTLVPSVPEEITVSGEKFVAQMISFKTGNETLDKNVIRIWLTANERVPVRFSFGSYQADLIVPAKK